MGAKVVIWACEIGIVNTGSAFRPRMVKTLDQSEYRGTVVDACPDWVRLDTGERVRVKAISSWRALDGA